jgi:cell division protein YceG involved in septum cleavage
MNKKETTVKQNKKHGISQERLHGMTISMVSNALWALLVAVVLFLGIMGAQQLYQFGYKVFSKETAPASENQIEITIKEDAGTLAVGRQLEKNGIIDDAYVFYAQSLIFDLKVIPGTYVIDEHCTSRDLLEQLSKGPESST